MAYSDKLINHFENPQNVGSLDKNDDNVGTGLVGAPACGDVMKLQLRINPETGVIEDAKFKTFGCGSAIASSSLVTTRSKVEPSTKLRPFAKSRSPVSRTATRQDSLLHPC